MIVNDSIKISKNHPKFFCNFCNYLTCKKTDYKKHELTKKHIKNDNDSKMIENVNDLSKKVDKYECSCGKSYKYDSGYYRHKKVCSKKIKDEPSDKELILLLLKQNTQLIEQNAEFVKNGIINTTNSHNNNSNNKTFNLQFFLNETCKDAMNITDFVNSIKLQLSDLENVGKNGYVEGISNIITTNLKALDITQRPIHCTDNKRDVLYIKDENKWEKEADEKQKIRKVIKKVANKNIKLLPVFKEIHPDCTKSESNYSDQYNKLVFESFVNDSDKENKIIKKISSSVTIDKSN